MATKAYYPISEIGAGKVGFSKTRSIIEAAFYGNNVVKVNTLREAYELAKNSPGTVVTDMPVYLSLIHIYRQAINAIAQIFRATVVDVGRESMTVMLTGDQSKLDAIINLLEDYEILELARTGLTGLSRGADDVRFLP